MKQRYVSTFCFLWVWTYVVGVLQTTRCNWYIIPTTLSNCCKGTNALSRCTYLVWNYILMQWFLFSFSNLFNWFLHVQDDVVYEINALLKAASSDQNN